MNPRNTCIAGLWLKNHSGRIQVLVQQAGGWYAVIDEPLDVVSHKMTALAIDRRVDAIDQERLLTEIGAHEAREDV